MKNNWKLIWAESAIKDLKKLDKHIAKIIVLKTSSAVEKAEVIKDVLMPLKYGKKGQHRIRIGNYRVICIIENDEFIVQAITVGHRRNVYK